MAKIYEQQGYGNHKSNRQFIVFLLHSDQSFFHQLWSYKENTMKKINQPKNYEVRARKHCDLKPLRSCSSRFLCFSKVSL